LRVHPRHAHFDTRRHLNHQPVQRPQPGSIQHRPQAWLDNTQHVGGIAADRSRRAVGQIDHQQQHAVPPLERLRRQKPTEQRVRLGHHPHLTRQDSTQLLQSVAFTPGTGKTHLSVGLARAAAYAGYRTYFTTAADLAARCHRAAIEGRWATTMRFYAGPTLLVIDELGYLPLPAEAASALFQVVSQRYLKTSIVITTNRGVGAWGEILGDTTVAAAMLDRLLHRSVVINLDGESYRLRDHHAAAETLRRAATGTHQPLH
jgi:IstB-like ATP binding protein